VAVLMYTIQKIAKKAISKDQMFPDKYTIREHIWTFQI
jgi:hypothetical protein